MYYHDLFIVDKSRIIDIIEQSIYRYLIDPKIIVEINQKIHFEKKYIREHKKYLLQDKQIHNTSEPVISKRWLGAHGTCSLFTTNSDGRFANGRVGAFINLITDSTNNFSFRIGRKITPELDDINIIEKNTSNDTEHESVESYLIGLSENRIRIIARYYNIYYKNAFITYVLNGDDIVNNEKNILLVWLYEYIDEYIYKEKISVKSHVTEENINLHNIVPTHTPPIKTTLLQRTYGLFSKLFR